MYPAQKLFIYRGENAKARSTSDLCQALSEAGCPCVHEDRRQQAGGDWIVIVGAESRMTVATDADGSVNSVLVHCRNERKIIDRLRLAFQQLGWIVNRQWSK